MHQVTENQNNYIIKNYNIYGENFLDSPNVSLADIQKNAVSIVKDILNKRIDLSKYGRYILNPDVLENIILVFNNYTIYYKYIMESIEYTRTMKYNDMVSEEQVCVELEVRNYYKTYSQITQTLQSIMFTKNITEFDILAQRLKAENLIFNLK